jgi:type IV secretion system protein TrbJ
MTMVRVPNLMMIAATWSLSLTGALVAPTPACAQMPVFDATNYAQNLLQASRALELINQKVQSLQNEAAMLENMGRNLKTVDFPQLSKINSALQQINALMGQAKAISFKVDHLDTEFEAMFPDAGRAKAIDQRVAEANARLDAAMQSFRHSMKVQAEVVSNIERDSKTLDDLASTSQNAAGALQVEQATNQLLALSAKQQLQLQDLLSAQFRSASIENARRIEGEAEGRASTKQFLGTGKAYSSTHE